MKTIKRLMILFLISILLAVPCTSAAQSQTRQNDGDILVGRISYIDGQLLRYVPEDKDWVAAVIDAPFGMEDSLYTVENSRAEFIVPNNTWIRIDDKTQIQVLALENDVTQVDVASGVARFYNRSAQGIIKATTPFGYVIAPAYTTFDLYVGHESVEVIALKGAVEFIHGSGNTKYEVTAGSFSILADSSRVASGKGSALPAWDSWNTVRDEVWRSRLAMTGDSVKYLPSGIRDEAYALEENGSWEQVYYDGAYRNFWRPRYVYNGWSPYTVGRWTVWYGDNCWIPYEPFGYVTHHYGSWVYVDHYRCWYWAPPVTYVPVTRGPFIVCSWYPGRVSWIYTDGYIGWVPLAPWEPYYCYNHWGPSSVVVNNINVVNIYNDKHHNYHYDKHAVVVREGHFYSVNNYKDVRIRNINNNVEFGRYQRIPVISDRVIKNFQDLKQRHNFTNTPAGYKPHHSAEDRIKYNQARQIDKEPGNKMLKRTAKIKSGELVSGNTVRIPEVANKPFSVRRDDATRRQELFKQGTPDRGGSEPVPRETSKILNKKNLVSPISPPLQKSEPVEKGRHHVSEVSMPQTPKKGHVRIEQPEKPVKMKEGLHRPQPPQSAELTQPGGNKHTEEATQSVLRPIPPRAERRIDIMQPEAPVSREEGRRVTNQPHSVEPAQPRKIIEHERTRPVMREAPPVSQKDITIERPERPAQVRQERTLPQPAPHQGELRQTAPPSPAQQHQSPPARQPGSEPLHRSQQNYGTQQGLQIR